MGNAFWLRHTGYGLLLGASIAALEFSYYYPLVSDPQTLGAAALASALITWTGEGVLFALGVALFERWSAPRPLDTWRLALAVLLGAVAAVLVWQSLCQLVLHDRLGILLFRDRLGVPMNFAGNALYHVWMVLVFGGLAAAVYASRERHARMLAALRAAELAREDSHRALAEARLAALQTRVDPDFLFQTLTKLERLYEVDPASADGLLDALIAHLRKGRT